jgi:GNAT superfamily N-acetyltransferase
VEKDFIVRALHEEDIKEALALVWRVFLEFEAPDYTETGVRNFKEYIGYDGVLEKMQSGELYFLGCFDQDKLGGVIALRSQMSHISLLFVQKEYHRQGIARRLMIAAIEYAKIRSVVCMTVHSSPYAVGFYERLGFIASGDARVENGIRYTPMKRPIE